MAIFIGKCNRPEPQHIPAGADPYAPVLKMLQEQRQTDSLSIVALQRKVDSLQQPKKQARQKAKAAIVQGKQTTSCDSLRNEFNNLTEAHEQYVAASDSENVTRSQIVEGLQRINESLASEIKIINQQKIILQSENNSLKDLLAAKQREADKWKRKAKRRGNILKVVYGWVFAKGVWTLTKLL